MRSFGSGSSAQVLDGVSEVIGGELRRNVSTDDDRRPPLAVSGAERPCALEVAGVEGNLLDRSAEQLLGRRKILPAVSLSANAATG